MTEKIQKVKLSKDALPLVSKNNTYILRYRVVSEDQNSMSEWSKPVIVNGLPAIPLGANGCQIQISSDKNIASIVWGDENNRPAYDVFVKFGRTDVVSDAEWTAYYYHGTPTVHNYSVLIPETVTSITGITRDAKYIRVKIQIANSEQAESNVLTIFESTSSTQIRP
jgi:hypothetical protein